MEKEKGSIGDYIVICLRALLCTVNEKYLGFG